MPEKGAIVCSCFSVGASEIAAAVRAGCVSLDAIGKVLKAGTNWIVSGGNQRNYRLEIHQSR
jgi:NAD(P)H-nitrite reductase large subunit